MKGDRVLLVDPLHKNGLKLLLLLLLSLILLLLLLLLLLLVHKRTLNHLAKLAKRLSCVVSSYLYSAFDCMLFSCHARFSEGIYTVQFLHTE